MKTAAVIVILIFLLAPAIIGSEASTTSYTIHFDLVSAGDAGLNTTSYVIDHDVGQVIIGERNTTSYTTGLGLLYKAYLPTDSFIIIVLNAWYFYLKDKGMEWVMVGYNPE